MWLPSRSVAAVGSSSPGDAVANDGALFGGKSVRIPAYQFDGTKRVDTSLVLAIAAWLIFNSHLEDFHPYRWMAADGMLGNSLFYFISGFGIQSSLANRHQALGRFAARRIARIYVSLLLVSIVFGLTIVRRDSVDFGWLVSTYIYPTNYTYIKVILPCYVGLWLLSRMSVRWSFLTILAALALFIGAYALQLTTRSPDEKLVLGNLPEMLWDSYFWILVASGALYARWSPQSAPKTSRLLLLVILLAGYFASKFVFVVTDKGAAFYPVLFLLVFGICILALATLGAPGWVKGIMRMPIIGPFLGLSSVITLEIYLVHEPLAHYAPLSELAYPLNIAALVALTLPLALMVNIASTSVQRILDRWLREPSTKAATDQAS